jgi:threonine dehydrogenase-like Zn-dependent dehydrogenase
LLVGPTYESDSMKAIALIPGTTDVRVVDRPEPSVRAPNEVKLQVLQVGICGTDREQAAGGRADAPPGQRQLVIGHEMFGKVVEVGSGLRSVQPGDYAVFTVRRGCGHCGPCARSRSDLCESGDYTERGIRRRDGYQTEFVVDEEQYLVKVPRAIGSVGVLAEPMSVAEKAIDEAVQIQMARLPDTQTPEQWLKGKRVLVAGLGPIGLLAAFALRLRGAHVFGLDIVDPDTARPNLLTKIGGTYVGGPHVQADALGEQFGQMALIFEATGVAALEFNLLSALGTNGVYVLTGIPGGDRPVTVQGAALMRQLVLGNQALVGSVNASTTHFEMGVRDLTRARQLWGNAVDEVITHRHPYHEFAEALSHGGADEIKAIIEWAPASHEPSVGREYKNRR